MVNAHVLIIDNDPQRRAATLQWLRANDFNAGEASSDHLGIEKARLEKPDLILLRLGASLELFHRLTPVAEACGTLVAPFIEQNFSAQRRREALAMNVHGFISDALPEDEQLASIRALIRQKRAVDAFRPNAAPKETLPPLRERMPELYKAILNRYEEAIKRVLQHRIYKLNDDVFDPFRQIARELFMVNATARDTIELHYQTLRKIAPTPEAPRAQAYIEVGRTTIVGLMGDLLTFYRDAREGRTGNNQESFQNKKINQWAESTRT